MKAIEIHISHMRKMESLMLRHRITQIITTRKTPYAVRLRLDDDQTLAANSSPLDSNEMR